MSVQSRHPFRLTDAFLAGDRLWFRYEFKGRVTAVRIVGPSVDLPLEGKGAGHLVGPVPEADGRLTLLVESVDCEAIDLPWRVDIHLSPQAMADYRTAEPLGAAADLGSDMVLRADRIRQGPDGAGLFWSCRSAGRDLPWTGELHGNHVMYPHGQRWHRKGLRPAPAGQVASAMEVRVQAVSFVGAVPSAWVVQHGHVEMSAQWELDLQVPPERPAALAVGQEILLGTGRLRLEEVWLGKFTTCLLISGGNGLDLFSGLALTAGPSTLESRGGSQSEQISEYQFAPLPPGMTQLRVSGTGAGWHLHHPAELPLVPGGKGRPVQPDPGQWNSAWGSMAIIGGVSEPPPASNEPGEEDTAPAPDQAALQEWLKEQAVPAHRLAFEPAEFSSLAPRESHLAGSPFRRSGEAWPVCGQCDEPLTFVGQVRLPGAGNQLITFYYCHPCMPHGPEDASAYRLHLYDDVDALPLETVPPPGVKDPGYTHWHPVPCRISLAPALSAPHWEDAQAWVEGMDLGPHPWQAYRTEWEALTEAPNMESRVGGYPDWIQGSAVPPCPCCGQSMDLLWQLDSEEKAGIMWGDTGRIYIFGCSDRCSPQALALVMQCC